MQKQLNGRKTVSCLVKVHDSGIGDVCIYLWYVMSEGERERERKVSGKRVNYVLDFLIKKRGELKGMTRALKAETVV